MKKILQICTLIALLIWGGVFIYFYVTGRIERHLDPSFRIYALIAGIGFAFVALFNLLTFKKAAGVCNHDHAHGDECEHEHHHHDHSHDHKHDEDCDHEHDCGHDHDHDHSLEKKTVVAEHHEHSHDETASGLAFALLILVAPILMAAHYSKDSFSMNYLDKWGKIESQMQQMRIAEKRAADAATVAATDPKANNPYANPVPDSANPGDKTNPDDTVGNGSETTGEPEVADGTGEGDEWGEFTLEDLKKMVPQSSDGDFLLDVPQIFYTAGDRELMEVMEGISVETTAQLMEEAQSEEGAPKKLKAFRLFIECCAADARPLSVPVEFPDGMPDYKEMGWYKMIGELHYSKANDEIVPTLRIKSLESTTEPVEGLLY